MKIFKENFIRYLICTIILISLPGNSFSASNKYGAPISSKEAIPIGEVFDHPAKYNGKTVTLKGRIDMQDDKGHWFYLADEEARIYVDLYDSGFVIPDLMNKTVIVEGKIEVKMNVPSIFATGLEWQV